MYIVVVSGGCVFVSDLYGLLVEAVCLLMYTCVTDKANLVNQAFIAHFGGREVPVDQI